MSLSGETCANPGYSSDNLEVHGHMLIKIVTLTKNKFTFSYIISFWNCKLCKFSEYELKYLGISAGGRSRPQEDKEEKRENIPLEHTQQGPVSKAPIGRNRER
jgi:hypothetical protein